MKQFIAIIFIFLISSSCSPTHENQVINDLLESRQVTATRILQIEDTAEDPFGSLGALTTDSDGQIYVVDNQSKSIRIYDPDGRLIQVIGREGKGPGEFVSISNLTVEPQEQKIWVYDVSLFRVSVFAPQTDSTWVYDSQFSIESDLGYPMHVNMANNQFLISAMSTVKDEDPQRIEIALQSAGVGEDTKKEEILRYTEYEVAVGEASGEFVPIHAIPFSWQTHLQVEQSGQIYLGKSDSLRVRVFNLDGQQKNAIKNQIRYQPVTAQDIEEYGAKPDNPTYQLIPDHHPAFVDLQIDDMGRPWFNLGELEGEDDVNTWVVLDEEGLLTASVTLPSSFNVQQINGQNIYGINQNDTGQQSIMVYSVSALG